MEVKIVKYENQETKKTYLGIEICRADYVGKVFPKQQSDFVMFLDLKPSEISQLPVGVIKEFKEVK